MLIKSKNNKFKVRLCSSTLSHVMGLMFSFPKNDGVLLKFEKENKVILHTIFVFFNLDVVYINKDSKIIKILRKVRPFKFYIKPIKCKYVLEVKDAKKLRLNDKISFKS